jgi:hypothetical protein
MRTKTENKSEEREEKAKEVEDGIYLEATAILKEFFLEHPESYNYNDLRDDIACRTETLESILHGRKLHNIRIIFRLFVYLSHYTSESAIDQLLCLYILTLFHRFISRQSSPL